MSLTVNLQSACYRKKTVLRDLSFHVPSGSLVAVIGRNGSGKSTLIACAAGLMSFRGTIAVDGVELRELDVRTRARYVSALLQNPGCPHVTVRELVSFGRNPYRSVLCRETDADRAQIARALEAASLTELADRYVDRISGGEARRAYFGAMLAQNTPVILLDEATAFMDAAHERQMLSMARALADSGRTVLSVMHDLSQALTVADRVLLLDGGRQIFFGTTDALLATELVESTFSVCRYTADGHVFFR